MLRALRTALPLTLAAAVAACNSDDLTDVACGPSDECPDGLMCEPVTRLCIKGSAGTDARVDAAPQPTFDARPDAPPGALITTITPAFDIAAPYNGAPVRFTLTATLAGATFECRLDSAAFAPCATPYDATVAEGTHTLTVRATAGTTVESSPPSVTFTIDRTPPSFTLTGADGDATTGTLTVRYTLAPTSDATGLTFTECTLDGIPCTCGAAAAACPEVSAGEHIFSVAARDRASNQGPSATNTTPYVMSYGAGAGRAVLMGHDFGVVGDAPKAMLRAAFGEVPFVLRKLPFTRKVRLATFESTSVSVAESANALLAVAGLYETTQISRIRTSTAAALDVGLRARDVLLVFDQENASTSGTAGKNWGASLRRFLDAGGIVIVLDGLVSSAAASRTYQVLSAGGLMAINGAAAIEPAYVGEIHKVVSPTEVVNGDVSPLAPATAATKYSGPSTTVVFTDPGTMTQRWIYQRNGQICSDGCQDIFDPVVIEKVFPAYSVDVTFPPGAFDSGLGSPNVAITVGTTPASVPRTRLDCSYVIAGCQAAPCSGACPSSGGGLRTPSVPGVYDLEVRLIDSRGVAGESWRSTYDIRPLYISDFNPQLTSYHCVNNYTYPERHVVWTVTKTTGAGTINYPFLSPGDATACQNPVDLSFQRDESCSAFGNLSYKVTATDDGGNVATVTPYSWTTACP